MNVLDDYGWDGEMLLALMEVAVAVAGSQVAVIGGLEEAEYDLDASERTGAPYEEGD